MIMNKKYYDFVYLTNTPSFYKLNLCEEIAKKHSLLLVLYGYGAEAVNKELDGVKGWNFDFHFIHEGDSNARNKLKTWVRLCRLMRGISCKRILYAGWLAPEYNLFCFFSPKRKNVVISESSIWDISLCGVTGWVKRRIIGRMGAALPSGKPHADFFRSLDFKGKVEMTGSVGIFNKGERRRKERNEVLRYLYVGRLIDVKNIGLLIEVFNRNGKMLTIVGAGDLEKELKQIARSNISFTGFIANEKLGEVYQAHDVFILPSKSETWGLVVEEAIYWGLPVIVSDRVGSSVDMVKDLETGCVFHSNDRDSLHACIESMERDYTVYKTAVDEVDFDERDRKQVEAYVKMLD